ncbi:MAG: hypothetical protein RL701_6090 [Pseudomonadota bacterium]
MVDRQLRNAPIVVIGTGPGGAAAALALVEAGARVLVMEVGADTFALGFTARVRGITLAKRRPPLRRRTDLTLLGDPTTTVYEALAPGGLSNQWSCAVPRFSADDFDDAARAGAAYTWPIGYSDLAPWYERIERRLHVAGSERDVRHLPHGVLAHAWRLGDDWTAIGHAAEEIHRSVTVMPYANGAANLLTRGATAFNVYNQLLVPALQAKRLDILFHAHVRHLEWSSADKRVVAVVYRDTRTGDTKRILCSGVVVAAGAINSARLLSQSRSADFPGGLGNQHGLVGKYLHDHPLAKLIVGVARPVSIYPASYITRPALAHAAPLYAAALMQWCGTPALAKSVLRGLPGRSRSVGFSVFGTMIPTPETYAAFADDRLDAAGDAQTSVALRYAPEVYRTLEQARDDLLGLLERSGWQPSLTSWKIEPPGESVHYAGTCRMHASEEFGVVNSSGRVYGVPNVAIGDSSVFTTGPEKNPVLTAMALSARAADRLAADLRS